MRMRKGLIALLIVALGFAGAAAVSNYAEAKANSVKVHAAKANSV